MRIFNANRRLLSAAFLPTLATVWVFTKPASAVMPPSTCLIDSESEAAPVVAVSVSSSDLKLQILEQIRKNKAQLAEIEQENRALSTRLKTLTIQKNSKEPRS